MEPTLSRKERKAKVASDATPRTTLSFYRYVRIGEPAAFRDAFFARLQELGCLGRIYIASEGINAQMNVPTENFDAFRDYIDSLGELGDVPFKIAVEEGEAPSFYKLTIKVKGRIVADGVANGVLDVTPELLKGKEDAKIALYCTGGIRCEKASAWLKHKGFKDVKHLKGGIIDYKRQVDEEGL